MKIEEVNNYLQECIQDSEDGDKIYAYKNGLNKYLEENGISEEVIKLIIQGINIDRGEILDFLIGLDEKKLNKSWIIIKKNDDISNGTNINAFKFIVLLFCEALNQCGDLNKICVNIFLCMMNMIDGKKRSISIDKCKEVIKEEFVENIDKNSKLINWNDVKNSENQILSFTFIMQKILEELNDNKVKYILRPWIAEGLEYAKGEIEYKKIMESIPKSRVGELKELVVHYEETEKVLLEKAFKINSLEKLNEKLKENLLKIESEKRELEHIITDLKKKLDLKNIKIEEAGKEIQERKEINDAFDALKESDEKAMLKDIGGELKSIYIDYSNSVNDKMDIELGEIYRDNVRRIFKILKNKGVEVE